MASRLNIILKICFYVFVAFSICTKIPGIYENFKLQNRPAPEATLKRLSGEEIAFPIPDQKMILIFWATWCGPCQIEMKRLNQMMARGEIKSNELIAINMQETKDVVAAYLEKNSYQFIFALDESGQISEKYKVSATPTIVFLDKKSNIEWITSGLSPTLEFRINHFFKKN